MTDAAIAELAPVMGVRAACRAAGRPQASHYRRHRLSPPPARPTPVRHPDRVQPRALAPAERAAILAVLHEPRFVDASPAQVWATLLDEGVYLGSQSTFYRLLRSVGEVRERRRQATHPARVKPELFAAGPNQVYSWDITKLLGPRKWTYYYLYVILDVYSRLRRRLDGRVEGVRRARRAADRRHLHQTAHQPRATHRARRPR